MSFITRSKVIQELMDGEFHSTGKNFTGVGGSEQVSIVIQNNNSEEIYVPNLTVRSQFRGHVEKGFNPTIDTKDTNLSFINKKSDATDSLSNTNAFTAGNGQTGAITADGDNFNDKFLPAGNTVNPGTQADIGGNILAPGDDMYVRAVNTSNDSGTVSIDIDFIKMNRV